MIRIVNKAMEVRCDHVQCSAKVRGTAGANTVATAREEAAKLGWAVVTMPGRVFRSLDVCPACLPGIEGRKGVRVTRSAQPAKPADPPAEITYIEGPVDLGLTHEGD